MTKHGMHDIQDELSCIVIIIPFYRRVSLRDELVKVFISINFRCVSCFCRFVLLNPSNVSYHIMRGYIFQPYFIILISFHGQNDTLYEISMCLTSRLKVSLMYWHFRKIFSLPQILYSLIHSGFNIIPMNDDVQDFSQMSWQFLVDEVIQLTVYISCILKAKATIVLKRATGLNVRLKCIPSIQFISHYHSRSNSLGLFSSIGENPSTIFDNGYHFFRCS